MMPPKSPSEETLIKLLDIQWQDHFQTRAQTWKTLEITALLAVALVGFDWRTNNTAATAAVAALLFLVAQFGVSVTLRHRSVEVAKFKKISELEAALGVGDDRFDLPQPNTWWSIFKVWRSNTSLFILRMHFLVQLFSIGYFVSSLLQLYGD
jgi:hypothetical protein